MAEKEDLIATIPKNEYKADLEAEVSYQFARVQATNPFNVKKKYIHPEIPVFKPNERREQRDWELEEIRRCIEGHDGMSGRYYYYWAHTSIKHKSRGKIRPDFRATQMHLANTVERIMHVPGLGLIILKRRQCGESWYFSADNVYDCQFNHDFDIGMNSKSETDSRNLFLKHKYIHRNQSNFLKAFVSIDRRDAMIFGQWDKKNNRYLGNQSSIISVAPTPTSHAGNQYRKLVLDEAGEFEIIPLWANAEDCIVQDGVRVGTPILFGCVCAGTKVWTATGDLINVEDLRPDMGIIGYDGKGASKENIPWFQPPAEKECYKIVTNTGRILECSDDHPILVKSKNRLYVGKKINSKGNRTSEWGEYKENFVKTKDLKEGDQVVVIESVPIYGSKRMWEPRLIGWLIGDGSYRIDSTPCLSNCEAEIHDYIDSNFSVRVYRSHETKTGKLYRETFIKGICHKLREIGIYGQTGYKKTLPMSIHSYSKEDICELLGGLFDTDGYSQFTPMNKSVSITSMSFDLLNEIRMLLQKIGVHGGIKRIKMSKTNPRDRNDHFRLTIADKRSLLTFHKNIKFSVKFKQVNLEKIVKHLDTRKERIQVDRGVRYERIVEVKPIGKKPIYNLEAGVTHTYVANGIITHNTSGDMSSTGKGLQEFWKNHKLYNLEQYGLWGYNCLILDELGNDNLIESLRYIIYERKRREGGSKFIYNKFLQKYPLNEADAFLDASGGGVGDPILLGKQRLYLFDNPPVKQIGWMRPPAMPGGKPDFVPDPNGQIIVYERPDPSRANGYCSNCDPAEDDDVEKSRDSSELASTIVSRPFGLEPPKLLVEYSHRPKKLHDYYLQWAMVLQWFNNTPLHIEMNKGGWRMLDWFTQHYPHLLALAPASANSVRGGVTLKHGVKMTQERKTQMRGLGDAYVENYVNFIPSIKLIDQFGVFGDKGKDDDLATSFLWCLAILQGDKTIAGNLSDSMNRNPTVNYVKHNGVIQLVTGNTPPQQNPSTHRSALFRNL